MSVNIREVAAQRPLVGGFSIAQRVQASMDLVVGNKVVVPAGSRGTVLAEYTDTRLTVVFEEQSGVSCFNVLPLEILPWCPLPCDVCQGALVRAMQHLMSPCGLVPKGTKGTVLSGVDASLVFVAFENGLSVAAAIASLELADDTEQSEARSSKCHQMAITIL